MGNSRPGHSRLLRGRAGPCKATLAELLGLVGRKTFKYLYDFGDGWEHSVKAEAIAKAAAGPSYPRLVAATGACPPEEVGGPGGYADFLAAIADPKHERHAESVEWRGEGFDPAAVDEPAISKSLAALAKRFARSKKPGPRRSV